MATLLLKRASAGSGLRRRASDPELRENQMFAKLVGAGSLLLLCIGITFADEIRAVITKVEGDRVTFAESKGKGQKGQERTLPVADNVKVVKGKMNRDTRKLESGDAISEGLRNKMFTEISEKITEIRVA